MAPLEDPKDYVRKDVYDAEKVLWDRLLQQVQEDVASINERLRWLMRTIITTAIMLAGNFVFLMLTRGN